MIVTQLRAPDRIDRVDSAAWTLVPLAILILIPIGYISGDGLGQSDTYANGTWLWNPNHLLYEPLGAWWQALLKRLNVSRAQPDLLTLLSVTAGSLSLGIFRRGIAGAITNARFAANIATLWVAVCAAYATLWVSQEAQMVQMPFLMLSGAATLSYFRAPSVRTVAMIGIVTAVATLFYASNALIAVTLSLSVFAFHVRRHEQSIAYQRLLMFGLVTSAVVMLVFGVAWTLSAPVGTNLLSWVTSYRGGTSQGNLSSTFGMRFTAAGVIIAVARALYGSALAMVDITPLVDAIRSRSASVIAVCLSLVSALTLAIACAAVWRLLRARRSEHAWSILAFVTAFVTGILAFGVYWNNSDDQFYFQLAIPVGALVASFYSDRSRSSAWLVAGCLAIAWNAVSFVQSQVFYPRAAYVRSVTEAVAGAGLVLFPGEDESARILYFVPRSAGQRRVALAAIANRYQATEGLKHLADSVNATLQRGERVDAIGIFDALPYRPPWKQLEEVGYSRDALLSAVRPKQGECHTRVAASFSVLSCLPLQAAR